MHRCYKKILSIKSLISGKLKIILLTKRPALCIISIDVKNLALFFIFQKFPLICMGFAGNKYSRLPVKQIQSQTGGKRRLIMTERFDTDKWNTFESSGRVADYLSFKGLGGRLPVKKEVAHIADNNGGGGNFRQGSGGQ